MQRFPEDISYENAMYLKQKELRSKQEKKNIDSLTDYEKDKRKLLASEGLVCYYCGRSMISGDWLNLQCNDCYEEIESQEPFIYEDEYPFPVCNICGWKKGIDCTCEYSE